jgi:hypothetical protein
LNGSSQYKKIRLSGLLPEYLFGFLFCPPLLEARKLNFKLNIYLNPYHQSPINGPHLATIITNNKLDIEVLYSKASVT